MKKGISLLLTAVLSVSTVLAASPVKTVKAVTNEDVTAAYYEYIDNSRYIRFLGDTDKVYYGKAFSRNEGGESWTSLHNFYDFFDKSAADGYSSGYIGGYIYDFDLDGTLEMALIKMNHKKNSVGYNAEFVEIEMYDYIQNRVLKADSLVFDNEKNELNINIAGMTTDECEFDAYIYNYEGYPYICLETVGTAHFYEESAFTGFAFIKYEGKNTGGELNSILTSSYDLDYYPESEGETLAKYIYHLTGVTINPQAYLMGGDKIVHHMSNVTYICGARVHNCHPAATIDYGGRQTYYSLNYDAVKPGDNFTNITFYDCGLLERAANNQLFRLYSRMSGEHFYTVNPAEKNMNIINGLVYEGVMCKQPTSSNTPVYRLYNPNSGEHHYTPNATERDNLIRVGWSYENIAWYSDDAKTLPLYRLYNPNAVGIYAAGAHHYTTNAAESAALSKMGWQQEDIGWYGM